MGQIFRFWLFYCIYVWLRLCWKGISELVFRLDFFHFLNLVPPVYRLYCHCWSRFCTFLKNHRGFENLVLRQKMFRNYFLMNFIQWKYLNLQTFYLILTMQTRRLIAFGNLWNLSHIQPTIIKFEIYAFSKGKVWVWCCMAIWLVQILYTKHSLSNVDLAFLK